MINIIEMGKEIIHIFKCRACGTRFECDNDCLSYSPDFCDAKRTYRAEARCPNCGVDCVTETAAGDIRD